MPACQQTRSALRTALAMLLMLLAVSFAQAQEIYRSVDAQGHVVFSDRGASKNAPKTSLRVEEGDPAEAARLAKQQQLLTSQDTLRAKEQAADDKSKAADARQREQACKSARNDYNRLMDANRLYQRDADGNRSFYSDEEAVAMRAKAKKAMDSACAN